MIVDLTQFWRDHPHYVGAKKEFGVYGVAIDLPFASVNQEGQFQVALDHDFIMTEVNTALLRVDINVLLGGFPQLVQVLLPGHGGRQLYTNNPPNAQTKVDYAAVMRTQPGSAAKQNSVVWTWPYPVLVPAGERITVIADATTNTTVGVPTRLFVGFQGIKAFL